MRTRLKVFRVQQHKSQQEMAAVLGYKHAQYGHVERGLRNGSAEFWTRLQAAFGLSDAMIEELKKID